MSTFETDEYRFPKIPDSEIIKSMNILRDVNLVVAFHSENDELILDYIEEYQRKNKVYPRAHAETRPPVTETSSTLKLLEFAYWTKAKLHIVHVSHPRTIELIDYFKSQGTNVTAETCFPYLLLNTNHLDEFGPLAKINPPLRESKDVEQMWQYLEEGKIDFVSSDHAPWKKEQKDKGRENIFLSQSGLPGVELLAPIMYDGTVAAQKMTPIQFAKVMARHPAETFQIKNKGKIKAGYDADFMIIDPHQTVKIDVKRFRSKSKFSPFNGRTLNGKITHTIVRGKVVFDGEEITVDPGYGQFVPGSAIESNVMS
nr:dihydroorotase family protein [Halalkalibacter wakoensis]